MRSFGVNLFMLVVSYQVDQGNPTSKMFSELTDRIKRYLILARVAGLGRLSAGAKMALKPFVKRVFSIFATNASFLRVISNF